MLHRVYEIGGVMEETEILDMFFCRSENAIVELEKKYGKICRRIAYNILHNQNDADECLNDTYLGAWNTIPPNRPDSLKAYICKIARNTALKRLEYAMADKRNCESVIPFEELGENFVSFSDDVDQSSVTDTINKFLRGLKKDARVMFVKRYYFAESIGDIAVQFGISENNVSVKLTRIRKKLKQYLEKEGFVL